MTVEVSEFDGKVVYTNSTEPLEIDEKAEDDKREDKADGDKRDDKKKTEKKPLKVVRGMNELEICWQGEGPKILEGMILWCGRGSAARPSPGDYSIKVTVGGESQVVVGRIDPDPRTDATIEDLQRRYRLVRDGNALVTEAHEVIETIRSLRDQMAQTVARMGELDDGRFLLEDVEADANAEFTAIEEALYQTKSKSRQDPLNFPIKLTDKLLGVLGATNRAEFGPTNGQRDVAEQLSAAIRIQLDRFQAARQLHVRKFNRLAREWGTPHIK